MVGVVTSEQRPATKTVRILLVDDHPVVRQGLRMMIEREGDMQVCGEANGMAEAMKSYFENKPEVVVVDISLHNGSGIELVKELIAHEENLKI